MDKRSSSRIAYQIAQHIIDGEDLKAFSIVDSLRSAVQQRSGDGLLPCPFCDVANDINQKTLGTIPLMSTFMECGECGCRGPLAGSRSEAVALWNTRASGSRQSNTGERMDS